MAVFDVAQHVINASAGIISGKYCHRCFGIGNNGRNTDGNGFGAFARLVPTILYRAGHDVRLGNHHLCDRLRSNDWNLPDGRLAPIPLFHFWKQRAKQYRTELSAFTVCNRIPGILDYDLRRHLCGADSVYRIQRWHHRFYLGCYGLHRPLCFKPCLRPGSICEGCIQRSLRGRRKLFGSVYSRVPWLDEGVKTKVFFNLTKRQLLCFGAAALIGVPIFFLVKATGNVSLAALFMMIVMLPLFFLAMYEKDGQLLEVVVEHFIQTKFVRPKVRPYQTDNYYDAWCVSTNWKRRLNELFFKEAAGKKHQNACKSESETAARN